MKVFIYSKKTSKTLAVIKNVVKAEILFEDKILFTTDSGEKVMFDVKEVKSTTYQN